MPKNIITPLSFKHLKPTDAEQLIKDGGNLYVRIRAIKDGGSVSFRFFYRFNGKQKWLTLEATTLADARSERDTHQALIKAGIEPSLERKLVMERARSAQLAEQAELARLAALATVNELFNKWVAFEIRERKDLAEIHRLFEKDVLPTIGALMVQDVRKWHITELVENMKLRDAKHTARNMLKLVRQMFRYAVYKEMIERDPTAKINIVKATAKPAERERVLSDAEIRALARQLPDAGLMPSTECAVWIALSTLCRIGELSKAKRSDVDFNQGIWTIPAENSKNGKAHAVYLSDFALAQFKILFNVHASAVWLFPNTDGTGAVCDKSITKQLGGRQSDVVYSKRSKANHALVLSGGKWTPHDLRRTGATVMGGLGVAPDVIEKCLNHAEENKMKRVYQRQELKAEQAAAWQVLGERLALLINMDGSNVLLMKRY